MYQKGIQKPIIQIAIYQNDTFGGTMNRDLLIEQKLLSTKSYNYNIKYRCNTKVYDECPFNSNIWHMFSGKKTMRLQP